MLKEMGEARAARFFAARSNVVGHVDMDEGVGFIFVQDNGKAVVEFVFRIRDDDLIAFCRANRFNFCDASGQGD